LSFAQQDTFARVDNKVIEGIEMRYWMLSLESFHKSSGIIKLAGLLVPEALGRAQTFRNFQADPKRLSNH
jgi:hypothetical protein